ncbi:MAG: glycosyltransferase family 9 protein [Cyclobacteriaceae bacterium]|nr:glycosyltransferase family 9 protein [Cyclobacteriaceae bacterium]
MKQPESVLIIQTAFIGDVILATALLESLHHKFPEAKIDFVVRKGNEALLQGHPFIRELFVFDKKNKFRNLIGLIGKIRKKKYDYVINVQRFATTGIMTVLSGAKVTVGFDKNPLSFLFSKKITHQQEGLHEVERNNRLIEFLTGSKEKSKPRLYPTPDQFEKVKEFTKDRYITVSPASVWFTKQFPVEKWIEFVSEVPDHFRIFILGAPSDKELGEEIIRSVPSRDIVNLAGKLSLLESAALMKNSEMNYVNDSAPMHLSSALNAPVSAVYCSTVTDFGFGPLSDKSFVIEIIEDLDCRPCGLHGHRECPMGHFKCALNIQKEQLLATIIRQEPSI